MAIDRKVLFDGLRHGPFSGKLSATQVKNIGLLIDETERRKITDLRYPAYMLATMIGETGLNITPVREGFKDTDAKARAYVKSKKYAYAKVVNGQVYYGRGLVQLTWAKNYKTMGGLLGIDLYNDPDLALDQTTATQIMFEGMILGSFTTKHYKLGDFFNNTKTDWTNARRIINGLDRADEIAGYAKQAYADLELASK